MKAIKEAIAALPADGRHSLAVWPTELGYDDWEPLAWRSGRRLGG